MKEHSSTFLNTILFQAEVGETINEPLGDIGRLGSSQSGYDKPELRSKGPHITQQQATATCVHYLTNDWLVRKLPLYVYMWIAIFGSSWPLQVERY